jgi:hypothetical protein
MIDPTSNSHEVITSATPELSMRNVSALTPSKNSRQNSCISNRPIRMIAAIRVDSHQHRS